MMEETLREDVLPIDPYSVQTYRFSVLVAGSGAAGLNAADTLFDEGVRDMAIVTEGLKAGTSRNTGSDKQTYYKLSLGGDAGDSVRALAETLFNGQSADGDICPLRSRGLGTLFYEAGPPGNPFSQKPLG